MSTIPLQHIECKVCTKCRKSKSLASFSRQQSAKDGHQSWCKQCLADDMRLRYQRDFPTPMFFVDKRCSKCKEVKAPDEFKRTNKTNSGLDSWCRSCVSVYNATHKDRRIGGAWLRRYGLSSQEYYRILDQQRGVCAICEQPEKRLHKGEPVLLCVDHDHKTGKVRGLLCKSCNTAIGLCDDNVDTLARAILYLSEHTNK